MKWAAPPPCFCADAGRRAVLGNGRSRDIDTADKQAVQAGGAPTPEMVHLKHNHVLHERILLVSTLTTDAPYVAPGQRAKVTAIEAGLPRVILSFGFMEKSDVAAALFPACQDRLLRDVDPTRLTYYLRRETVISSDRPGGMARWRKALFAAMLLNANRSADDGLPLAQVVEVGLEVES